MTREEAKNILKNGLINAPSEEAWCEAFKMAIDTLTLVDDIKAEIKQIIINGQIDEHTSFIRTGEQVKTMALDIIDKHCGKENTDESKN